PHARHEGERRQDQNGSQCRKAGIMTSHRERAPWVYRCKRHNNELESLVPKMPTSLKIFCPLCRDEWMALNITDTHYENTNTAPLRIVKPRSEDADLAEDLLPALQGRVDGPEHPRASEREPECGKVQGALQWLMQSTQKRGTFQWRI